jgi:hypothetical protein
VVCGEKLLALLPAKVEDCLLSAVIYIVIFSAKLLRSHHELDHTKAKLV